MGLKCGAGNIIRLLWRKESVIPLAYLPLFHFYRNAGIEMQTCARARADARVRNSKRQWWKLMACEGAFAKAKDGADIHNLARASTRWRDAVR